VGLVAEDGLEQIAGGAGKVGDVRCVGIVILFMEPVDAGLEVGMHG
jgi:hypothetical protein